MKLELIRWTEPVKPREGALRKRLEAEGFAVLRWCDDAGADYQDHPEALVVAAPAIG